MSTSYENLFRDALKLPPAARAALAGSLIQSLEEAPDPDAEAEWQTEISKRMRELDQGSVPLIPWAEARRAIHGGA